VTSGSVLTSGMTEDTHLDKSQHTHTHTLDFSGGYTIHLDAHKTVCLGIQNSMSLAS